MSKYLRGIFFVLLLTAVLVGCKKNTSGGKEENGNVDNEEEQKWTFNQTIGDIGPNDIVWVCNIIPRISEENQNAINRVLQEKGIDCQIRFIVPRNDDGEILSGGEEYAAWVYEYEKKGKLDIITSNIWTIGDYGVDEFVKNHMIPLNSYLETPNGLLLKDTYTDDEWKQCSIGDQVYVIPKAGNISTPEDSFLSVGIFIAVNDSYSAYFDGFDGTYSSLKDIFKAIGNNELRIVLPGLPSDQMLCGLMGWSFVQDVFPFRSEEGCVVDITKSDDYRNLLSELVADYKAGILVNRNWETVPSPENVLAYIHMGRIILPEGFTDYCSAPDLYDSNLRARYGISVGSTKKEQAFSILSMCLSDMDLLSLLYPGADELLKRRKELLEMNPKSNWAGVRIVIGEDVETIQKYRNSINGLFGGTRRMKNYDSEGAPVYEFNPEYDLDAEWKVFIEKAGLFPSWCDAANKQIQEWSR